ncbi:MAG: hypothetical protein D6766_11440 [Verrucomicrobia bacterium]|nr:MAG: hypothetical protein D6766_11440 [Verrucomicrobiota bacterium]
MKSEMSPELPPASPLVSSPGPAGDGRRMSRRSFLLAGAGGLAALSAGVLPKAPGPVAWQEAGGVHRALPEALLPSACGECPAGCELLLRKVGDWVVGVRPIEPKPCLRAYTLPQQLVHPDRIRVPMARDGGRGGDRWTALGAEEAEERLASWLEEARGRVAVLVSEDGELASRAWMRLGAALAAPHVAWEDWVHGDGPVDAFQEATGWARWTPDLAEAAGVLAFGFDFLQALMPPVRTQEALKQWQERKIRPEVVTVGPRLDLSSMRADEWLPCRVGREPLVALAMAAMLVKNKGWHPSAARLPGFDALVAGLGRFDIPGACEQAGVQVGAVARLVEYLADRRWLCLGPRRRLADQRPVALLNALLGRVGEQGGWLPEPELRWKSGAHRPGPAEAVPAAIAGGQIDLLLVYRANPAFATPEPARWRKALQHVRRLVVFTDVYQETARLADLVLPVAPPAERRARFVSVDGGQVRVREVAPVMPAPAECPDPLDLALRVARRLAPKLASPMPTDAEALVAELEVAPAAARPFTFSVPEWTAPSYSAGRFHLLLETPLALLRMTGGHLPYLISAVGPHLRQWWETTVEINPETARELGVADRQLVKLSSEVGTIHARAKLYAGVPPDAVCVPLGLGHTLGAFAGKVGGNPAELVKWAAEAERPLWTQTKVNVEAL